MSRYGWVIQVSEEKIDEYKALHRKAWPEVLKMIKDCHISNYSIYLREITRGDYYLFSYLEYHGDDFSTDMAKMAADPVTQKWWSVCKPCQKPIPTAAKDEWWANMEEVFHVD